ncbi:MAG: PEP-CTERM sorting domain-containing protein [Planctomycetota bacterium]
MDILAGPAPVPEPASSAVVALLMGGAALRKWRKNKNKQDAQEPCSESLAS